MQLRDRRRELAIAPLWRLGFRPFFLAGSAFALLAVAAWLGVLSGLLQGWQPTGGWLAWHRHEMPFGFAIAIIAGFLLTAVQNWTGQPGLAGRPLVGLFVVWLLARLAWLAGVPLVIAAPLQLVFLPLLAWVIGRRLWRVRQRNNYPVVLMLLLLAVADGLVVLGMLAGNDAWQRQGVQGALWLVAALMGLIGGRVIPFFTQRGLGLPSLVKAWPWLEWGTLGLSLGVALSTLMGAANRPVPFLALPFAVLGAGHLLRLVRWYHRGIWRVPLLWSLHLAFAWLVVAPFGLAAWHLGWLAGSSPALHALAVGAMGGLILGMLARVSLGHTGRALVAPAAMGWAFGLLNLGAALRVFGVGIWPLASLLLAGACWILAFALFLGHYGPMFWRARVDGQPG